MEQLIWSFLLFTSLCCLPDTLCKDNLQIVKEWIQVEVAFPDNATKQAAIASGEYVPKKMVPIDVEVHYSAASESPRIFVTFPRLGSGRAITLGELKSDGLIHGYPDYDTNANQGNNCDGLSSVYRVAVDKCNQLWVLDTGKINGNYVCAPQLLTYNLDNDQLVFRHRFPKRIYSDLANFVTPIVDTRSSSCDDTFVYIADNYQFGLVVVDVKNNNSWRASHRLFYPYPNEGIFTVDGVEFTFMDGVVGMTLSELNTTTNDRQLYFHALASVTENVVNTSLLRNTTLISSNSNLNINDITVFKHKRKTQSAAEALDSNGIMYFGAMEPPSILCWNTATEFHRGNFHQVAVNKDTLQFASGIKVVNNTDGEQELWVMTDSIQKYVTSTLSNTTANFRIHTGKISELIKNSACLKTNSG